jgi:hypothetical protein
MASNQVVTLLSNIQQLCSDIDKIDDILQKQFTIMKNKLCQIVLFEQLLSNVKIAIELESDTSKQPFEL